VVGAVANGGDGHNSCHFCIGEFEIKDLGIRGNAFRIHRLGHREHTALYCKTDADLGRGLAVGGCDLADGGIAENSAAAKGRPRFH